MEARSEGLEVQNYGSLEVQNENLNPIKSGSDPESEPELDLTWTDILIRIGFNLDLN